MAYTLAILSEDSSAGSQHLWLHAPGQGRALEHREGGPACGWGCGLRCQGTMGLTEVLTYLYLYKSYHRFSYILYLYVCLYLYTT